jgi:hypothetical protein
LSRICLLMLNMCRLTHIRTWPEFVTCQMFVIWRKFNTWCHYNTWPKQYSAKAIFMTRLKLIAWHSRIWRDSQLQHVNQVAHDLTHSLSRDLDHVSHACLAVMPRVVLLRRCARVTHKDRFHVRLHVVTCPSVGRAWPEALLEPLQGGTSARWLFLVSICRTLGWWTWSWFTLKQYLIC